MNDLYDGSDIIVEFVGVDTEFSELLDAEFPDDEIAVRSSFSGLEIATVFASLTPFFIEKLAKLLNTKIDADSKTEITVKHGDKEITIKGCAGKNLETVKPIVEELMQKISET